MYISRIFSLIILLSFWQFTYSRDEKKYLSTVTRRVLDTIFNPNITYSVSLKPEISVIPKGFLLVTEFIDKSCKNPNGTIALLLDSCLSIGDIPKDSKELAFKLTAKIVDDTYETLYQGFSDKSCHRKLDSPRKRITKASNCYDKLKWKFDEKLDTTNRKKGVALASFKSIDACNKNDMSAINGFVSVPYGICRDNDDQLDDKFTGCDSSTIFGRSYSSSDKTCQGKATSWIVPRMECLDISGSPLSYLCV